MKVVFIVRSNLFKVNGGDTIQVRETAKELMRLGISVVIKLTDEKIDYSAYDLLHFFNIIRPADILVHIRSANKPYVISTIFVEYTEFDKNHRKGLAGFLFKFFSPDFIEYAKVIARLMRGNDKIVSRAYLWLGQKRSIQKIVAGADWLLPNSENEFTRLQKRYAVSNKYRVVPNGIGQLFVENKAEEVKDANMIICVARIEGIKNQLNLVKAMRNKPFRLYIIGGCSPNQKKYYRQCKQLATSNITFFEHLPQHEVIKFYRKAKVHVLPSWFETTGLSSLEAAAMGCNVVITNRGDAKEYLGEYAFYCNPGSPESIFEAIQAAASAKVNTDLAEMVKKNYTWEKAARVTHKVYNEILKNY